MLTNLSPTAGDMIKVYKHYSSPEPPPIDLIRRPAFLALLIKSLFFPELELAAERRKQYAYVLAYACSAHDSRPLGVLDLACVDSTLSALESCFPITDRKLSSEISQQFESLQGHLKYPVVSMGVLHWIGRNFLDSDYYNTNYNKVTTAFAIDILREIIFLHPPQWPTILELLVASFEMDTPLEAVVHLELKHFLMDTIILLMLNGHVLPVLEQIKRWLPKIDQSLIRYFATASLGSISAPYSATFTQEMTLIIGEAFRKEHLDGGHNRALLLQFFSNALQSAPESFYTEITKAKIELGL